MLIELTSICAFQRIPFSPEKNTGMSVATNLLSALRVKIISMRYEKMTLIERSTTKGQGQSAS